MDSLKQSGANGGTRGASTTPLEGGCDPGPKGLGHGRRGQLAPGTWHLAPGTWELGAGTSVLGPWLSPGTRAN